MLCGCSLQTRLSYLSLYFSISDLIPREVCGTFPLPWQHCVSVLYNSDICWIKKAAAGNLSRALMAGFVCGSGEGGVKSCLTGEKFSHWFHWWWWANQRAPKPVSPPPLSINTAWHLLTARTRQLYWSCELSYCMHRYSLLFFVLHACTNDSVLWHLLSKSHKVHAVHVDVAFSVSLLRPHEQGCPHQDGFLSTYENNTWCQ